ncbi:MAG: threonine ammonia-lyase, partial [Oscillospiraceae bacterium]|nr:threonine ammonia-lyase [Oscillospiraceae bacterium]
MTDMIEASALSSKNKIYLKTENLQRTGSFKIRGAYCKISKLTDEEKSKGVIACSAGNHAQGVALAAEHEGISSIICLPDIAPISKIEATKKYGANIVRVNGVYDDAYNRALEIQQQTGRTFIHPFDDIEIIAGQGTVGLEIFEQLPEIDAVVVPIGGGGLISGIAYTLKNLKPEIKVYGVQASGAPSMYNSIKNKEISELSSVSTIADGIAVKKPGIFTYDICTKYVDDIFIVSDDEISTAILTLIEKQKIISEGAGAVAIAAVLFDKIPLKNKNVVCLVSGGNIDVTILSRVINRGLLKAGRTANLKIALTDRPGQLRDVSRIIANLNANVISIYHNRADENMP